MPWWVEKDTSAMQKAAASPGPNWVQIPGAADSDTQQQAVQQLAQDAASGAFGSSPGNGITKLINDATGGALTDFQDVAHALSAFYDVLTDGKMWRSLGWLALGIALMFLGIGMLMKNELPPIIPV